MSDEEPAENIGGGDAGGSRPAAFEAAAEPATRAEAVIDALGDLYWRKAYGGRDAFGCLVRTVLSQNTSDKASQPAHDALLARYGPGDESEGEGGRDLAASLADAAVDELAETISGAGLYNVKSERIVALAEHVVGTYGGAEGFDGFVRSGDPDTVRETLLELDGVGPKTADCVLLFAGGREGVFPVDTHVHRIARRTGLAPADADHEGVREALAASVPPEKCGFGHTATIQFGREYCTARDPACLEGPEACPLYDRCDRVGVNELTGEAVDPSEAVDEA
ncbi:endonuclease III [Halobacteriales archaeon QS_6_71_20]|nr:MAG: endonuclease III [Halobacteriales archaeon QS_6_71_20]